MQDEKEDELSSQMEPGQVAGEKGISDHGHEHFAEDEEEQEKVLENFVKAGKITSEIASSSKSLVMEGESLIDVVETIEKMIYDAGAKPAFPATVCLNDYAAHYAPELGCDIIFGPTDVAKVDFGVSVEGSLSDTAYTIDLSGNQGKLLEAAKTALDAAVSSIKPGVTNGQIGRIIEAEIKKFGYKPIENLTGHMLSRYLLHAGVSIPNVATDLNYEFQEGDIFAVEPFATNGQGSVNDTNQVEIFSLVEPRNVRMRESKRLLAYIIQNFFTLPFAERWLAKDFKSKLQLNAALRELMNFGVIQGYPALREAQKGLVSQFEYTILVEHDGARILTDYKQL
ncbi:type II methionyl aminopeptidase [Candidatus Parvarchaeota archaeon]|nr:type II methionyl aminopeptidase [Candidatus Parvarchaeota archaeon]